MNRSRVKCRRRNNNLLRTPGLRKDLLSADNAIGISHLTTRVMEAVPWKTRATGRHVASTSELDQNSEIKSAGREASRQCVAPARKTKNLKLANGLRIRAFRSLKRIKPGAGVPSLLSRQPPMSETSDPDLVMNEKTYAIKENENQTLLEFVSPAPALLSCCDTFSLTHDVCPSPIQLGLNTKFPSHFEETIIEGFSVLAFDNVGDMLLYSRMTGAEMLAKDAGTAAAAATACSLENGGTSAVTSDRPSRRSRAAALTSVGGGVSRSTGHGNKRALSSLPASGLEQAAVSKMDELQDLTTVGGHSSSLLQPLSIDTDDLIHDIDETPETLLSDRGCHLLTFRQSQSENGDTRGSPKAAASLSLSSSSASPSSSMAATNHVTPTDTVPSGFSKHEVTSVSERVRRSCSFTGSDTSPPDLSPVRPQPPPPQHRQRTPKTARSTPNRKINWSQGRNGTRDEDPFVTVSGSCFSGLNFSRAPPGVPSSAPLLSPAYLSPSKTNSSNAVAEDKTTAIPAVKALEDGVSDDTTKPSVPAEQLSMDNAVPVLTKPVSRFSIAVLTGDDSARPNSDPSTLSAATSVPSSFARPVVSTTPPKRTSHQTAKKGLGTPVSPSSSSKRSPTTGKSRAGHRGPDMKPSLPLSNGATGPHNTLSYPPMPSPPCSASTAVGVGAFPLRQSSEWFSKLSRLPSTNSLSEEQVVEIAQHILYDPVFREGVTALPCFDDLSARLAIIWSRLFDPTRSCPPQSFEQFPPNAFNTPVDLLAQMAYTKPPENLPPSLPFDGGFPCRPPFIPLLTPLPNALLPGPLPFPMGPPPPPPPLHLPSFLPPQLNGRSYDELPAMPGLTPAPFRPGLPPGHSQPCASDVPVEPQSIVHSRNSVSSHTPMPSASDSSQKAPWVPSTPEFLPSGWDAWESVLGSLSTNSQIQRKLSNSLSGAVDLSVAPCQNVPSFGQMTPISPQRSHVSVKSEHSGSCSRSSKGPSSSGIPLPAELALSHHRDFPLPDQRDYQNSHPMPGSLSYVGRKHSPKQPCIPRFCNVLKLENTVPGNGSNAHVRIAFHIVRDKYASSFNLNSTKSRLPWFNNSRLPRPRATRPSGRAEKRTTIGNFPSATSTNFMPPLLPGPATPAFNSPSQLPSQFANSEEFMTKFLENMFSQIPAAAAAAASFPNMAFSMAEMQEHFSRALDSNRVPLGTPNPVAFEGSPPGPPTPSSVIDLTRPERIPQMLFPPPPPPSFQTSSRLTASSQKTTEKARHSKARDPICTSASKRSCDPGVSLPSEASTRTLHNQPQRHTSPLSRFPTASAGMMFLKPPALEPVRSPEGVNGTSATCALELEAKRRRPNASDGPEFEFVAAAAAAAAVSNRLRASPKDRRDWDLGHVGSSWNLPPPEPSSVTMQSLLNAVGNCHRSHKNLNPL